MSANKVFAVFRSKSSGLGGGLFSFFKGLAGQKTLTIDNINPVLDKMKEHLVGNKLILPINMSSQHVPGELKVLLALIFELPKVTIVDCLHSTLSQDFQAVKSKMAAHIAILNGKEVTSILHYQIYPFLLLCSQPKMSQPTYQRSCVIQWPPSLKAKFWGPLVVRQDHQVCLVDFV